MNKRKQYHHTVSGYFFAAVLAGDDVAAAPAGFLAAAPAVVDDGLVVPLRLAEPAAGLAEGATLSLLLLAVILVMDAATGRTEAGLDAIDMLLVSAGGLKHTHGVRSACRATSGAEHESW